jgi:hypothetical protein
MPKDLADLYPTLWQEVVWLHVVWNQFIHLFGTEENGKLVHDAAPGFFRVCRDALADDVVLSLCRLTDPAGNRHQQNLSILRVADAVRAYGDAALTTVVERHRDETVKKCEVLR